MVHWSILRGIKNTHSAINFENTTHVYRNDFDQTNLGEHNFSNIHNLLMKVWIKLL